MSTASMTGLLRDPTCAASAVRELLDLAPHPEGGHYRELWRDRSVPGRRGAATSILFLLGAGERSHWHRVDATEIWLWQAGAPLQLDVSGTDGDPCRLLLGPAAERAERLQGVVPMRAWQQAASLGDWTLVSCVVAPAFEFSGFELAPAGWSPPAWPYPDPSKEPT